jgi:hypothetical protein
MHIFWMKVVEFGISCLKHSIKKATGVDGVKCSQQIEEEKQESTFVLVIWVSWVT